MEQQEEEDGASASTALAVDSPSSSSSSSDDASKRLKTMASNISKHLLCAITEELMVDPVLAEDGRTYERAAIEEHIRVKGADLKSPITNEPMGPRLVWRRGRHPEPPQPRRGRRGSRQRPLARPADAREQGGQRPV